MDYDQLELQRETIFKDAVLKGAEQRARKIVEKAEMDSQREIQTAIATCEEADHDTVAAASALETARQVGALSHEARRDLLAWRDAQVCQLFEEVEDELAGFAQGDAYSGWLGKKLQANAGFAKAARQPVVYLRTADMSLAAGLEKVLPEARIEEARDIKLGGLKLSDGKRLLDLTLDAALAAEKERFYAESELWI